MLRTKGPAQPVHLDAWAQRGSPRRDASVKSNHRPNAMPFALRTVSKTAVDQNGALAQRMSKTQASKELLNT
jgi:hypothetical protein